MGCWLAAYPRLVFLDDAHTLYITIRSRLNLNSPSRFLRFWYDRGCDETGDCINSIIAWFFVGGPLLFTLASLVVNNIIIFVYVKKTLQVTGRRGQVQIRRVATQGFLYVGACFISYIPAFILRLMGSRGHRLSTEADVYDILVLQSSLLPLQGFLNMLIYIRPVYLRLRHAGTSRWMAIRGACLEADIQKFISEAIQSAAADPVESKKESLPPDKSRPEHGTTNDQIKDTASGTDDDFEVSFGDDLTEKDSGSSKSDGVEKNTTSTATQQPTKSILKKKVVRVDMNGSIP